MILDRGIEVDLVEIKAARTLADDFFKGFRYFGRLGGSVRKSYLIYGGDEVRTQHGVEIMGCAVLRRPAESRY